MKITVWGCRGSLPTPGRDTIKYGGNTTCLEIRLNDGTCVIIDAGSGIRGFGKQLLADKNLTHIYLFLTHAHWDHLMGFPFFAPVYSSGFAIHVRGGPRAKHSLSRYLKQQMEVPYFPVPFSATKAEFDFTHGDPKNQQIGSAQVIPIPLNHQSGGYGFKLVEDDRTFVFLTDNELDYDHQGGLTRDEYVAFCKGADLLLHDGQYTNEEYKLKRGWGHTTFASATDLSVEAEVKRLGLFHHDPEHTDDDMDGFVATCQKQIAGANSRVQCFGVQEGMVITV